MLIHHQIHVIDTLNCLGEDDDLVKADPKVCVGGTRITWGVSKFPFKSRVAMPSSTFNSGAEMSKTNLQKQQKITTLNNNVPVCSA